MRLRLSHEAKSCDPLGCEPQTPRPCVLFSPMPCRHQAPCGAPTPTGVTETRQGGASVRLAARRMEAWMTVTSCRAGTRGHCCFMSKGGAACVHFRKVMPPSRWKGEAGVTVRSGHSRPSPLGWHLPLQCLGSSHSGPLAPASARHFQLEHTVLPWEGGCHQSVCGGGGPSKALSSGEIRPAGSPGQHSASPRPRLRTQGTVPGPPPGLGPRQKSPGP